MTAISKMAALAGGLAFLASAGAAGANDSTAELATGGLVLTKNAAIQMKVEDLYLSPKQVWVHYVFLNTSAQDVTVTVAFPMPDITTEGVDDMLSIPTQDPQNILGFSTQVEGKTVVAQVEQRVFKNGVERTALLKSLGIPLAPHLSSTDDALDRLPQATKDRLVALGLAVVDEYGDSETTMKKHWEATWTLKTTYFWRQTFPAGRELVVDHAYQPSLGESAGTGWGSASFEADPSYAARRAHYCVDDAFIAAVKHTMKPGDTEAPLIEERLEYILTSGANWGAPIGDFRMVVSKDDPNAIVSFCGDGVKKTSPTQFEVHHTNFTPTKDVSILILAPIPKPS